MKKHNYDIEAERAAAALGIDTTKELFNKYDLARGMAVEYEHGTENPLTNVTGDDPIMTAKIALAHLYEKRGNSTQYDYYDGLDVLEEAPPGYWRGVNPRRYWLNRSIGFYIVIVIMLTAIFATWYHFEVLKSTYEGAAWASIAIATGYLMFTWK